MRSGCALTCPCVPAQGVLGCVGATRSSSGFECELERDSKIVVPKTSRETPAASRTSSTRWPGTPWPRMRSACTCSYRSRLLTGATCPA
uniref:Secreted protein n=1 Tax=Macrostomum lignano TaxID=282301 RepID=A0A1I8FB01_9PLAT